MDVSSAKKDFLKNDLYNTLKELFVGAVTWQAHPQDKDTRYLRDLGMFTCLVQARALYEFFYCEMQQTRPGGTACARHFAPSWKACDPQNLHSRYMGKDTPAQKRVFHLAYCRSDFSGGEPRDPSGDLKNQVLAFAKDLRRLTEEFAAACDEKEHRELAGCALAKGLRDGYELARTYGIPTPL